MNLVKELVKAKGLTLGQVATELGLGYHAFQKTVLIAPLQAKNGEIRFYECRHIREKIAAWLGYPYELIWGPNANVFLRKLITEEIERQVNGEKERRLQALGIL